MKKKLFLIVALVLCALGSAFAQTKVDSKKLGKTLEKNKDSSAVFVSEIDLSEMTVSDSGAVTIPIFAKSKISVVSGMDMTNIKERIAYTKKSQFSVTFETKSLKPKTYAITKIDEIETVEEYNARLVAEKKRRQEEEKARYERERLSNLTKMPVQVVNQEVINVEGTEASWLPGQVQDKLKSNLQDYLGMKTVVDSKSESALKKLQAESESSARDEKSAIEFGKITTAKFAFFVKVRKTGSGYTLSADFTDLTTGEQLASVTSKEYTKAEYLYGSTGAADEITLSLANKLGIKISDLNKNLLTSGSSGFTTDELLALAKQNEEQYKKMMSQYDEELAKLNVSNDLSAIENRRKIEAEKALLVEKQNAEQKRQQELKAQKEREQADAKLEAERSIALKTQRDQMAKDAAAKAAEVRKLKMEKQGVLGQISVIESKKKALVEIRQGVEKRHQELHEQMLKDMASEESRIRNKTYSTVELGSDGNPTEQAKQRREKQVIKSNEDLLSKFFMDCDAVKKATATQDAVLLAEIRADQKALATIRTVSSMGDELKVSYGKYEGSKNGWNAYISLYSDGILLYADNFIVSYEALSGKKAPDMATELDDTVIEEYTNNVDMYNSLLTRGDPIIYFEIDYNVVAEGDVKPSQYKFNFSKIRVINTVSGKIVQTSALSKKLARTMKPEYDIREIYGATAKAKETYQKNFLPHNRRKELQDIGLSDERISEIYATLTAEWINTMPADVFKDLKEAALENREKDVFFIGMPFEDEYNDYKHYLLPNSVTKIGWRNFSHCYSLTSVTIPNSVTLIGNWAFKDCVRLTSVTIPNSVRKIGEEAFCRCNHLTSVTIPNSVKYIGAYAFEIESLRTINYTGTKEEFEKIEGEGVRNLVYRAKNINFNYREK
ncbi:MAG: leucine-rich repeat protein [Treponema sp.]|nr:leucine-rich repeat protein [Treponema sp.]